MTQTTTLREFFYPPKIYEAPIFQRRYKWSSDKELPKLWEDFANLESEATETLFLGAVITKPSQASHSGKTAERELIVDGQQRLATLSLVVLAAAVLAEEHNDPNLAATLVSHLAINKFAFGEDGGRTRVVVTTPDLAEYESLFSRLSKEQRRALTLATASVFKPGTLTRSFEYSKREIERRIEEDNDQPPKVIADIIDLFLDKTEIVEIQLEERHDPNEVFDRLNRQGAPLTVADLVRNHVFGKVAGDRELAKQIYGELWEPFEKSLGDKLLDEYFFPFAVARFPQTTKAKSMDALQQRWEDLNAGEGDVTVQVERIVDDLSEFVPAFASLRKDEAYSGLPKTVGKVATRLRRMNLPSVTLPLPMQILRAAANGDLSPKDAAESLEIIESFLVRRALVGLEATGLHAVFKVLWDRTAGKPTQIRRHIETRTIRFPSDKDIREGIEGEGLYGRRLCHYILEERELHLRTGDPLSSEQLGGFEVDHVAPQSLKGEWAKLFVSSDAEALVDTWGNLVPLSQKANSTKNAKSWDEAKDLLRRDTVYKSTMLLYEEDEWTPHKVEERNHELAMWATERWPSYEHYLKGSIPVV